MSFDWTDAALDRLRALWAEGRSGAAIAKALGCTKNAVIGKARRLGLAPRPSPLGTNVVNGWTAAEVAQLRALHAERRTDEQIARVMGRKPTQIRDKRRALGLAGRPRVGGGSRPFLAAPRPPRPQPALKPECRGALGRAVRASRTPRGPLRCQLVSGEVYKACCWPVGEGPGVRLIFCGAQPARLSTPYCEAHAAIAYRQPEAEPAQVAA